MRVLYLFFLIVYCPSLAMGQINLVPNPSFEDTTNCVGFPIQNLGFPWFAPTIATPDFFYGLNPTCGNSALNNPSGFQLPHTGNAYIGIYLHNWSARDYISVKLNDTLISGHNYKVDFYTSRANLFTYSTDKLGAYLSNSQINQTGSGYLPYSPQIINPTGNFLNDSVNWINITGIYKAIGGETYFTIGNFADSASTPIVDLDNTPGTYNDAYYYIDDVSIIDLDSIQNIAENNDCGSKISISPNPVHDLNNLNITVSKCKTIEYINIYDLSGKLCISEKYDRISNELSSNLNKGIYYIEAVTTKMEKMRIKLIII